MHHTGTIQNSNTKKIVENWLRKKSSSFSNFSNNWKIKMENVNSTNTNDHEMEDIEFSSAFSKDANKKVSITLHPTIFQPIERFEDNGHEIPEPKLTEKEEFQRSVQLLESTYRSVKKMKTSVEGNDSTDAKEEKENEDKDNEEDLSWMDPRIHYRPMVGALQNSQMELHQLIYLIDMIRGKSFLDETYCIREDVAPKEDELQLLIQMKAQQLKQAGKILQNGAASIKKAIEKERHFVADLLSVSNTIFRPSQYDNFLFFRIDFTAVESMCTWSWLNSQIASLRRTIGH